ncbi:hypothetical protein ACFL1Z_04995, partial [Thermodesulfobacteriota bacterium]
YFIHPQTFFQPFLWHQLFTGGQMGKDLFRAQKELGTQWFIQKTKEGMFRDFETEKQMLKEALAELDAREKAEKKSGDE